MGLIERGISPFGEHSEVFPTQPLSRRLPWFKARFPHFHLPVFREIAFRTGTAILSLTGLAGINPPEFNPLNLSSRTALAQTLTQAKQEAVLAETAADISLVMSDKALALNQTAVKLFGDNFDLTGNPISKGWNEDGSKLTEVFENMQLAVDKNGKAAAMPILDQANQLGLDIQLADTYSNLNPIPPKADITFSSQESAGQIRESIDYWQLDSLTADFVTKLDGMIETGPVVGYTNLGTDESPIEVFRTPSVAFVRGSVGPNAGRFVMINAGRQTQNLGIWPTEYALSPTDLATGGGGEILPLPEQIIEGPRKILATYIQPEAPLEVGPTPTFNQLEEHLFSQGVNRLEIKYNNFPELPLPGNGISWMSICPTNTELTCETPFIYIKRRIDSQAKTVRLELKLTGQVPTLSINELDYLNRAFQGVVGSDISVMKYGDHPAMIPDAKLKLEVETTLLKPINELRGFQLVFNNQG
ncbi:hypothetical protein HYW41_04900 [Candidatus Daviesbacteria bacterium]|nr:hypothetical protein [Candidatus Daviesbacteria bacterium]